MPMRESTLSKLEHEFLLSALQHNKRCDGRNIVETREAKIVFGMDFGCCTVELGETKVLAQVSAEMERPRESRPNEGSLHIHTELSTLASSYFDPTKPGELGIEIQCVLERSLIFSRCLDLEELCVRVGERCWAVHLYLHVLCYDGNILDCASIAAIASLKHFKRPEVTVEGQSVVVHEIEDRNPCPLVLHHMPFCTSLGFFKEAGILLADPTLTEEKVMDGKLIISINKHKEVCCIQICGKVHISKEQILHSTNVAYLKAIQLSQFVNDALAEDRSCKLEGEKTSSLSLLKHCARNIPSCTEKLQSDVKDTITPNLGNSVTNPSYEDCKAPRWMVKKDETVSIGEGLSNSWDDKCSLFVKTLTKTETFSCIDTGDSGED